MSINIYTHMYVDHQTPRRHERKFGLAYNPTPQQQRRRGFCAVSRRRQHGMMHVHVCAMRNIYICAIARAYVCHDLFRRVT